MPQVRADEALGTSSTFGETRPLRGAGLAWVNEWSVETPLREGRLVSVLDDWSLPFPGLSLYYPPHRHHSAALRAFVALIRELELDGVRRQAPSKKSKARKR